MPRNSYYLHTYEWAMVMGDGERVLVLVVLFYIYMPFENRRRKKPGKKTNHKYQQVLPELKKNNALYIHINIYMFKGNLLPTLDVKRQKSKGYETKKPPLVHQDTREEASRKRRIKRTKTKITLNIGNH